MDRDQIPGYRMTLYGAGLGLMWGAVLRLWMRFIALSPEFNVGATGFILGASLVVGSLLGWARYRHQTGGRGWWRLTMLSLLLLGAGGAVMWPSVVLGAVAIGRRRPRWLALLLASAAVGFQVPVLQEAVFDSWWFDTSEMVIATAWYAPMIAIEAWAFSIVFAPSRTNRADPPASRG
jgi:hypothetical protein